jgi:hypothetical protein
MRIQFSKAGRIERLAFLAPGEAVGLVYRPGSDGVFVHFDWQATAPSPAIRFGRDGEAAGMETVSPRGGEARRYKRVDHLPESGSAAR